MIYCTYCIIAILGMLSGCSWWHYTENGTSTTSTSSMVIDGGRPIVENAEEKNTMFADHTDDSDVQSIDAPDHQEAMATIPEKISPQKKYTTRREFRRRRTKKKIAILEQHHEQKPISSSSIKPDINISLKNIPDSCTTTAFSPLVLHRVINLHNIIDADMLTVRHWTGTYRPTTLTLTINKEIVPIVVKGALSADPSYSIKVFDNTLLVEYYYEFMNGMRKEGNSFQYVLASDVTDLVMSFNWDTPWHVSFDKADPIIV